MVITALKATKRHDRVNVYLDGEYSFTVYYDTLLEFSLKIGTVLDETLAEKISARDELRYAKFKAFDYLSRSPYSVRGMKRKLLEKGFSEDVAAETVGYLVAERYLDDEKYAADLCEYLVNVRMFGKRRLISAMYEKGLERESIDKAVGDFFSESENILQITAAAEKAVGGKDLSDEKNRRRIVSKLMRLGYDYDEIMSELARLAEQ